MVRDIPVAVTRTDMDAADMKRDTAVADVVRIARSKAGMSARHVRHTTKEHSTTEHSLIPPMTEANRLSSSAEQE